MLVLSIRNTCRPQRHRSPTISASPEICLSQLLPDSLQAWLHTLVFRIDGQVTDPQCFCTHPSVAAVKKILRSVLEHHAIVLQSSMTWCASCVGQTVQAADVITRRHIRQGYVNGYPAVLRLCLRAPANFAKVEIALNLSKRLMSVFDMLPDASR